MDLRQERGQGNPQCFACRWAGRYIVLWPREPISIPELIDNYRFGEDKPDEYTDGSWKCFANVHERIEYSVTGSVRTMKSRDRTDTFCYHHWIEIWKNWQMIAWDEVMLDFVWNAWVERTDR